jgi:hippurate hydrolase
MKTIPDGIAAAHGVAAEFEIARSLEPLVNDEAMTGVLARAAGAAGLPVHASHPRFGASEDFAAILARVPGAIAMIGQATSEVRHARPLHNPGYHFADALIPHGVAFWTALAWARLE